MASRSPHSASLAILLIPKKEIKGKLRSQIRKGHELSQSSIRSKIDFSLLREDIQKWYSYNLELLKRAFSSRSFVKEFEEACAFENPKNASWRDYGKIYKDCAAGGALALETILDRLDLIPEVSTSPSSALTNPSQKTSINSTRDVFIVHGHDEAAKVSVARFIDKLGLRAIILHERASSNRTVIEKLERHSDVCFAVVILTPDDIGYPLGNSGLAKTRARQNVIFELGYFIGKLGRDKVCALYKGDVEIPSDYQGVLYVSLDDAGAWRTSLAQEIKQAGINIDLNTAF